MAKTAKTFKPKFEDFNPVTTGSHKLPLLTVVSMVAQRLGLTIGMSKYNHLKVFGQMIPIEKVWINYKRQRWPKPKHIHKVYIKWNEIICTALDCRYDPNEDRYYISDGQQHGIAWCLHYFGTGEGNMQEIPASYWVSDDEETESTVLLGLNCGNAPMAKYFIHQQEVIAGNKDALALETTVLASGCKTSYNGRSPGSITHFPNLYTARDEYGLNELKAVLTNMRAYWPLEYIEPDMMLGLCTVRELLHNDPNVNKNKLEDIFIEICSVNAKYFAGLKQACLDIMEQTKTDFPASWRGVPKRFPIAAAILNVYSKKSTRLSKHIPIAPVFPGLTMP